MCDKKYIFLLENNKIATHTPPLLFPLLPLPGFMLSLIQIHEIER